MSKKNKYKTTQLSDNIQMVTLAINVAPTMRLDHGKGIIKYGLKNDYPEYLINLTLNSPSHGAIVNGKARYLSGVNIKPKDVNPLAEAWLKQIKAHDLIKRLDVDEVISGMEYILVNPNVLGQPVEFKHLDFAKCRISACFTKVHYSEDWSDLMRNPVDCYPIWYEGITVSAVMIYKRYTPSAKKLDSTYGKPEWMAATMDIDTDCEVNTFFNSLVKNNFSAGTIVTIFSGKIPQNKQDEIKGQLINDGTGSENAGRTSFVFAAEGAKGAEVATLNANDLDKQYQEVSKRNLQNILIGHGVSGVLFKLATEGALGQRNELIEAHELFLNEYVKPKQERRLKWLTDMFKLRTGQIVEFEFEQVQPIGLELPLDNQNIINALNAKDPNIITNYIIEKYGIKLPENLDANGQPVIVKEAAVVNDNLKSLTGREYQGMLRIVRDFDKGKTTRQQAVMLLKSGYGLTDIEAAQFLNENDEDPNTVNQCVHLSEQDSKFYTLFSKYAHDINTEDEVLDVEYMDGTQVNFAETLAVTDVRNAILNELKETPGISPLDIAKKLDIEVSKVNSTIKWLESKSLIAISGNGFAPTKKAIKEGITKTEIYTEYTYQLRPELKGKRPLLIPTSHEFCIEMVNLTRNKALTYEAIDKLSNDFGMNAWEFKGGFTGVKGSTEVKPWCNHVWQGETKIRKVKA